MTIEEDEVMVTNPLGEKRGISPWWWIEKKNGNEEGDKEGWIWIFMLPVIQVAVTEMWRVGMKSIGLKRKIVNGKEKDLIAIHK